MVLLTFALACTAAILTFPLPLPSDTLSVADAKLVPPLMEEEDCKTILVDFANRFLLTKHVKCKYELLLGTGINNLSVIIASYRDPMLLRFDGISGRAYCSYKYFLSLLELNLN